MSQTPASTSRYLDAKVQTASQPELQLMLLDGALRFGRQAQQLQNSQQQAEYERMLDRTFDIVEELVRSTILGTTDASKRLEEEYAFAYRQLARARLGREVKALETALKLLEFHRETWKLACEKMKSGGGPAVASNAAESGFSLQG